MAHLLDYDKDNRLVLDYLLCGLLLTKNLEIFKTVLTDFQDYFKKGKILKIQTTYRNSQELVNIAGDFIMQNKKQIKKD